MVWRKFFLMDAPKAREGHALAKINKEVYLYGGKNGVTLFDDLWRFDLENVQWTSSSKQSDLIGAVSEKMSQNGTSPGKIADHSMIGDSENQCLLLFKDFNSIFIFDVRKSMWT